ncbi:thiamine biosynthesis protein ApbE [Flavobacterium covae]|uniref:FAD:protein FMN transferase n=1 Tax=Flavobacterium covae TaxID=2906076 RepID=A0ABW8PFP3_9FLAO|nr:MULTISPECIES: FAD:protein FMN transferase [Flavobacterium]OXA83867.1 thiamine biosynthesis protein ApbE [Flavobacterium columnare NBRC 100251 = ATCC 23463]AND64640.1 thiamine biosynthesis protein ApbE [Flavobacterium covae]MCH4833814.1 FAD:protein FMN transferase [Flavobacterium columnare]MCJ1805892.1 FAD:protein FMN transferase [Flavobacterium covae]OWP80294.1 thiamine biosynthesis protein ApbE [Flavobacterium covae]
MKILVLILLFPFLQYAQVQRHRTVTLMGSRFDITIVEKDSILAEKRINEAITEIDRIENLISEWKPTTQISQVNQYAGLQPVKVDDEVIQLTKSGLYFSKITEGAFDISIVAMDKIWKFDGSMTVMPTEIAIKKSIEKVNYKNIVIDTVTSTIFLKEKGMKIGFGSIGKGYAADRVRTLLETKGVFGGIINASGDLTTWGKQANGKQWSIGITNPFGKEEFVDIVKLGRYAVTTSGSYEKYVEINGKKYSHIINPKTGYPSQGICSATVFGPSAEIANGFSTSIMVLGLKEGTKLLANYPAYSYVLVTDKGRIIKSKNFKKNKKKF